MRSATAAAACLLLAAAVPARAIRIERAIGLSVDGSVVEVVAERALVRFKSSASQTQRASALATLGMSFSRDLERTGWSVAELPPGRPVAQALDQLRALPEVADAQPDHVYRPVKAPNDPEVANQYHLSSISAFPAWEFEVGGSSRVTVAVIDSGIEGANTELSGKLVGTSQFCDPGANKLSGADNTACAANQPPTAACNHATEVAGVAAAETNNASKVAGVSWGAKLLSLKVFRNGDCNADCSNTGGNECATDDQAVIDAVNYAITQQNNAIVGRIVINLSLGAAVACPAAVQTAVTNAFNAGIVIVAAAGNYVGATNGGPVQSPGNCNNVIPIGATDSQNNIAGFSARGAELAANGLVAPGVGVVTVSLGGAVAAATGTSFSAPIVAGVAALILAAKPSFTATQVKDTLRGSTSGIGISALTFTQQGYGNLGNTAGAGLLNAFLALRLAIRGTLADFEGKREAIAFPNPFKPSDVGQVTITVPDDLAGTNLKIKIYTAAGQLVRSLTGQTWDGKNDAGVRVASGVYMFLVSTDKGQQTGMLALIR